MPCEDTKSPSPARPLIWLLLSDKQGDNKQVFSLADRLGCAYETRFVFPKPGFVKGKAVVSPVHRPYRPRTIRPPWRTLARPHHHDRASSGNGGAVDPGPVEAPHADHPDRPPATLTA